MLTQLEIDQLKQELIGKVREKYGIFLITPDVSIIDEHQVQIIVKGSPLASFGEVLGDPIESILVQLFEGDINVKERLIQIKLTSLEKSMREEMDKLKAALQEKYPQKEYKIAIVSLGYEGSSWMLPEEAEFGYPEYGIQIKDNFRFCCEYKIDSENPKRFFDLEQMLTRLDHQISSSF